MSLLTIDQLSIRFGDVRAVDKVSLSVAEGEVLGLVGESGSGKSTLGRAVCGLESPAAGQIEIAGRPLPKRFTAATFRKQAALVQMVFQDAYSAMNPRMTLLESLCEPLRLQGKQRGREESLALDWLDRIGLPRRFATRYPHELSGGQRQRLGIARAFITEPKLVICDEPVSALDVSVQAQIINLLQQLQRDTGVAMVFIAHDLAVVRHLAERTAVMYHGRIVELGGRDLFASPRHPYTQALVAANPGAGRELLESKSLLPPAAEGCAYRRRCRFATEACRAGEPLLSDVGGQRLVACDRLAEIEKS
ncbi:oligopeptide/dipeptide ABC transporter ATP-binding protein [Litorivivens lipolytica]|uniref:Oligopeptide/dipeptide ABC transporter ATP-binding protein n=1 Tax=Litorivivens lipolytica TaxID=1524264 RepID=A0A7W4Z6A4_9GAMM|nr:oligopeptide/dipeptide ABC transporter ATP-binding protein [Litorivivens lipolytica]MBB3046711.1 oligopeptide/dipeptide ABC transporter ATP-binding protein [Litorivivens lipolytica]